jgi:thioredoxin-related protein
MKKKSLLFFSQLLIASVLSFCLTSHARAEIFDDSEILHIDYPAWFKKSSFLDLQEDLKNASLNKKKGLMILFTTEGCSYCDIFIKKSLGDPEIAAVVQENFDSVGLEIFDDNEMTSPSGASMSVKKFAKKEGVGFSPTLLFYGNNGKRILRLVGYQSPQRFKKVLNYFSSNHYRGQTLRDYLKRTAVKAKPIQGKAGLKADALFSKPPYALDRSHFPAKKLLLVIFEKQGCAECEEFHSAVLATKKIRATLKKFEVVRLDADDVNTPVIAPSGKKMTPAIWYEKAALTRAPAMLFFDEKGNEVLRTDALVLHQRMMNSLNFVLERAYKKGWNYQRFARSKAIERSQKNKKSVK